AICSCSSIRRRWRWRYAISFDATSSGKAGEQIEILDEGLTWTTLAFSRQLWEASLRERGPSAGLPRRRSPTHEKPERILPLRGCLDRSPRRSAQGGTPSPSARAGSRAPPAQSYAARSADRRRLSALQYLRPHPARSTRPLERGCP